MARSDAKKLEEIFLMIQTKYTYAKDHWFIRKPFAYALYHTWRYVDKHEKERTQKDTERV